VILAATWLIVAWFFEPKLVRFGMKVALGR
jgi:hypothetical protein